MRTEDKMQIKNTSLKGVEFVEKLLNEMWSSVLPIVATGEAHLSKETRTGETEALFMRLLDSVCWSEDSVRFENSPCTLHITRSP